MVVCRVERGGDEGGGCAHLPGMVREIIAHLLPWMACAARICLSSSAVNGPRFTVGLSWLHHLSIITRKTRRGRGG